MEYVLSAADMIQPPVASLWAPRPCTCGQQVSRLRSVNACHLHHKAVTFTQQTPRAATGRGACLQERMAMVEWSHSDFLLRPVWSMLGRVRAGVTYRAKWDVNQPTKRGFFLLPLFSAVLESHGPVHLSVFWPLLSQSLLI
jgi:hypothetical protein